MRLGKKDVLCICCDKLKRETDFYEINFSGMCKTCLKNTSFLKYRSFRNGVKNHKTPLRKENYKNRKKVLHL